MKIKVLNHKNEYTLFVDNEGRIVDIDKVNLLFATAKDFGEGSIKLGDHIDELVVEPTANGKVQYYSYFTGEMYRPIYRVKFSNGKVMHSHLIGYTSCWEEENKYINIPTNKYVFEI